MILSDEQRRILRAVFPTRPGSACEDCGGYHLRACPRIKLQRWIGQGAGAGTRIEVEYFHWKDVDYSEVIFPEDVFEEDEDE